MSYASYVDPFRDELRVAHERIAQLERENAELRGARPKAKTSSPLMVATIVFVAIGLLIPIVAIFFVLRPRAPAVVVASEGIATAPLPSDVPEPAVLAPSAVPQRPSVDAPALCNCAPGDPLCSCLDGANAPFDRGAAATALGAVSVVPCAGRDGALGHVKVTFAPSGEVTSVKIDGPIESARLDSDPSSTHASAHDAGASEARCIIAAFSAVHVPPFSGGPITVGKTFSVPMR